MNIHDVEDCAVAECVHRLQSYELDGAAIRPRGLSLPAIEEPGKGSIVGEGILSFTGNLSEQNREDVQHAFEEDRDVLNAVQKGMNNKSSPHINLPIDGDQLRFRRQLQAMINEELQVDSQMAK